MYEAGTRKGSVKFSLLPPGQARSVSIAGSFNQWQPVDMKRQKDGSFAIQLPVSGQAVEYKFIVDGNWIVDPDNSRWSPNSQGSMNSVADLV